MKLILELCKAILLKIAKLRKEVLVLPLWSTIVLQLPVLATNMVLCLLSLWTKKKANLLS